jgi:hypothetical protein
MIFLCKIAVAAMGGGDAGMDTTDGTMLEMDANIDRKGKWYSNHSLSQSHNKHQYQHQLMKLSLPIGLDVPSSLGIRIPMPLYGSRECGCGSQAERLNQ